MAIPRQHGGLALVRRCCRWVVIFALVLVANLHAFAREDPIKLDCGANALYILLSLDGRPITLDYLLSVLPPRQPDGFSMADLASASRTLGLRLEGVRLIKGDPRPNRPAIAFVKDAMGGHFVVLRPVGTTGTMVQIIDPPRAPWITDYDRLLASRTWTGRILLVRDPWHVRFAIPLVLAGLCVPAISLAFWRQRRSSRRVPADSRIDP